jgi:hypothetical protein
MEEVGLYMLTATFMMVSGRMIEHMALASIGTLMVLTTKDNGKTTNNTDLAKKNGLTEQYTKETMLMERSKEKEGSSGQTEVLSLENSTIMIFMVKEFIVGVMEEFTMVIG